VHGLTGFTRQQLLKASPGQRKIRVNVVSNDATFADSLRAMIAKDTKTSAEKPFRSGKNLFRLLAKVLVQFDVRFTTDIKDEHFAFQSLKKFARQTVRDSREVEKLHPLLCPVAVKTII
jgi:hypothetical protein